MDGVGRGTLVPSRRPSEGVEALHVAEGQADVAYPDAFFRIRKASIEVRVKESGGIVIKSPVIAWFRDMHLSHVTSKICTSCKVSPHVGYSASHTQYPVLRMVRDDQAGTYP